jgi:hypothetical protein
MPQPVNDTIAELTENVQTAKIEVPVSMLRRAQAARSEYSDYGSNDEEHDILGEFCDLVAMAIEDVGYATWRIFVDLPHTPTEADIEAIKGEIPSDLADTFSHDNITEGRPTGLWFRMTALVEDEPLGVAQLAASEFLAAARGVQNAARVAAIDQLDR